MDVNLVPRFFAIVPDAKHIKVTVQEITDQMWSSCKFFANVEPEDGIFMCGLSW